MQIFLPMPPSTNNLYFNLPKGGRAKTQKYKEWIKNAGWTLLQQNRSFKSFPNKVKVQILIPRKAKTDLDNLKAILDFLVNNGVIVDDSPKFLRSYHVDMYDPLPIQEGLCCVTVSEFPEEIAA